jgi:hypothetical protein
LGIVTGLSHRVIAVFGYRSDASIERAGIAIIGGIGEIGDFHDVPFAVANIGLAIAESLDRDGCSHRREVDLAQAVHTGKRLTFAARAAVRIGGALHSAGARTARPGRSTATVLAYFGGASGKIGRGQEKQGRDEFGRKSKALGDHRSILRHHEL